MDNAPDAASARTDARDAEKSALEDDPNVIDVRLMLATKAGDIAAFEELVSRHQHAVVGTVAKMLGNASDAEDIAQQVFVRIWKSAKRYEPQAKFTTWLFTITRNLVFNESRRRSRKKEVSSEEREENFHQTLVGERHAEPDAAALQNELEAAVEAAIQSLPEKQRLAVVLRRYEDMPYEEIGVILELSLSAVKSLLFRARGQLKESLERYLNQ
jgi:RNA polymerase sigma-70 factor (ECF subfamily)